MNILENRMRDGSVDYNTGWLFDGNYLERPLDLSTGIAGLHGLGEEAQKALFQIPKIGQEQIADALKDPAARPIIERLLKSPNPDEALAAQAEADIAEAAHPTGKIIVFENLARKFAPKVLAAENAVVAAMPNQNTEEGETARTIIAGSDDPKGDLEKFYRVIALDAIGVTPEEVGEAEFWDTGDAEIFGGIGELGKPKWLKRVQKSIKKVAKVLKPVAIVAAAVLAAPLAFSAVKAVGGALIGGVTKLFGGGAAAPKVDAGVTTGPMPEAPYVDPSQALEQQMAIPAAASSAAAAVPSFQIPWDKIASLGVKVVQYKRAQVKAKAEAKEADAAYNAQQAQYAHEEAVQSLVNQGVSREQAETYVRQAEAQAQSQMPEPSYAPPPPPPDMGPQPTDAGAPGGPPGAPKVVEAGFGQAMPYVIVGGLLLLALTQKGGGKGRRTRRNPRTYYRSQRRRRAS